MAHLMLVIIKSITTPSLKVFGSNYRDRQTLLISASSNQLHLARRVRPFIKAKNYIHLHYSGSKNLPDDTIPILIPPNMLIAYFGFLFGCLRTNFSEINALDVKTKNFCMEKVCEVFLLKFFLERIQIDPKYVLIFTDLSPFGNYSAKFFRGKSKIIYIPHSPPLQRVSPPKFYDVVVSNSKFDMAARVSLFSK